MQTDTKYITPVHNKCVDSFINAPTRGIKPNIQLRKFIVEWVKSGKDISSSLIAREYNAKYKPQVTRQRVDRLIQKLGVKTSRKLRNLSVVFCIILGSSLGMIATSKIFKVIHPLVYPVYAVEPSITVLEGVVKNSQVASTSAGQTPPASTPSASLSDKEEVMDYILEVFGKDADRAIWMAKCESGLRKNAYNGSNSNGTADYGVFQINSVHQKRFGQGYMVDWKENVRVAKKIFDEQGFYPWTCGKAIGERTYVDAIKEK